MSNAVSYEARVSIALILCWTVALGCIVKLSADEYASIDAAAPQAARRFVPQVTGLDYQQYDARGLFAAVKADTLLIAPRGFFAFTFKSINELRLTNVSIEVHLRDDATWDFDLEDLTTELLAASGQNSARTQFGLITRCVAGPVLVTIFKASTVSIYVRAQRATFDQRTKQLRFLRASLEDAPQHRQVSSAEILWDTQAMAFIVPGDYLVQTASGNANGNGAKIDLGFHVTALPR